MYLRLLSGRCADPKYMYLIKKRDSPVCIYGFYEANLEHILCQCSQYAVARYTMLETLGWESPLKLCYLLSSRVSKTAFAIINFLKEIKFII